MPILDKNGLAIENTKKAFERRERTSEVEKLYISTHYYDIVTGEIDKSIEAYRVVEAHLSARLDSPQQSLCQLRSCMGKYDQAWTEAQETVRLAPNEALGYRTWAETTWDEPLCRSQGGAGKAD